MGERERERGFATVTCLGVWRACAEQNRISERDDAVPKFGIHEIVWGRKIELQNCNFLLYLL